jgi:hypothetical protein
VIGRGRCGRTLRQQVSTEAELKEIEAAPSE